MPGEGEKDFRPADRNVSFDLPEYAEGCRQEGLVADETETLELAKELIEEFGRLEKPEELLLKISRWRNGAEGEEPEACLLGAYEAKLRESGRWISTDFCWKD